jgi:hypothetical protein
MPSKSAATTAAPTATRARLKRRLSRPVAFTTARGGLDDPEEVATGFGACTFLPDSCVDALTGRGAKTKPSGCALGHPQQAAPRVHSLRCAPLSAETPWTPRSPTPAIVSNCCFDVKRSLKYNYYK